jgi:ribosome-associated protein
MSEIIEKSSIPENLMACCSALLDKKAVNLTILDVKGHSSITDYYVIASGDSSPQLRAMANVAKGTLKEMDLESGIIDGDPSSGWVVMDAYQFVVHLFLKETRENYALESLWKDRPRLVLED